MDFVLNKDEINWGTTFINEIDWGTFLSKIITGLKHVIKGLTLIFDAFDQIKDTSFKVLKLFKKSIFSFI